MTSIVRYTRFVIFGKHFLWALVAFIMALLVWIASDNTGSDSRRIVFTNLPQQTAIDAQNVMMKPRYQGLDAHNQPYTVVADKATQVDANTIAMENIRADMVQNDGRWIALNAKAGVLNSQTRQLDLTGSVNLFYEGGYEMRTDHAHVDIPKGSAYGDSHVEGQGPVGTLEADSFQVHDRGQVIQFEGAVKVRLYHGK